jgi:tetratricopeptide (TPR) repeat protein
MVAHRVLAETSSAPARNANADAETNVVPAEALTQYSLGLLYEGEGDKAKAVEHYQRALTAFPNYRDAQQGAQRVRQP